MSVSVLTERDRTEICRVPVVYACDLSASVRAVFILRLTEYDRKVSECRRRVDLFIIDALRGREGQFYFHPHGCTGSL